VERIVLQMFRYFYGYLGVAYNLKLRILPSCGLLHLLISDLSTTGTLSEIGRYLKVLLRIASGCSLIRTKINSAEKYFYLRMNISNTLKIKHEYNILYVSK